MITSMNFRPLFAPAMALVLAGCGSQGISVPSIFTGLKPQSYTWYPQRSVSGPVLVFVSIPRQEAVVYRNGVRIGRAACSTGKPGHGTPTGVFQILQKDIDHHSKTYDNAPMPYMERLTWDGVALHTGFNPGHPASHGCVRLPDGFAKELFKITHVGGTVIISNSSKLPTMAMTDGPGGGGSGGGSWSGLSKSAATSVVVSTRDRLAVVYQNGRRVASSPVEISGSLARLDGEEAFLYAGDQRWHTVEGSASVKDLAGDLSFPDAFRSKLHEISHPGTTMVITSEPISTRGGTSRGVIATE
jgi:lipoprotein-anchoring transpeptidase ErfK/SrfK